MSDLHNLTDRELLAYAISSSVPGEPTPHDGDARDMLEGIAQELMTAHHAIFDEGGESAQANTILAIRARVRVVGELLRREGDRQAPRATSGKEASDGA